MPLLFVIGRIMFGGFFIMAGYHHFTGVKNMTGYAQSKGVPMPKFAVLFSGILSILGGLSILLGIQPVWGIVLLLVFLIPVTYMIHPFWKDADPQAKMGNKLNFQKNLALIGALLMMLAITVPWINSL